MSATQTSPIHSRSFLSAQASSPKSKLYALNTKIHDSSKENNFLRALIKKQKFELMRVEAKIKEIQYNLNSLHREKLRNTNDYKRDHKATNISSKECSSLQGRIKILKDETDLIQRESDLVDEKIKKEKDAGTKLRHLSVSIRVELVKKMRLLASKKKQLAGLEQREKGSRIKLNLKADLVSHKIKDLQSLCLEIERLSNGL